MNKSFCKLKSDCRLHWCICANAMQHIFPVVNKVKNIEVLTIKLSFVLVFDTLKEHSDYFESDKKTWLLNQEDFKTGSGRRRYFAVCTARMAEQ